MIAGEATHSLEDIALSPQIGENERALLHALLQATDYGVLLTDLHRQDILANRRLGELFALSPHAVVETPPDVVRGLVRTRIADPEAFDRRLEAIYADSWLACEDELELAGEPRRWLRRFTAPVCDLAGQPVGRLWTFLDVTQTRQLEAQVQAQLEARTAEFLATSEVLRAMNELCRVAQRDADTEELLGAVAALVRPLPGFDSAAVLLLTEEGGSLQGRLHPRRGPAQWFEIAPSAMPAASELRRRHAAPRGECPILPAGGSPVGAALGSAGMAVVPLRSGDRALGALVAGVPREDGSLDPHRSLLLRAVADQVALTVETHRLQVELRTAMEALRSTQSRLVEMERLRAAGTLAASVAHDIRNILTPLEIDLAMGAELDREAVREQLYRFSTLTHRLLAFSRPGVLDTRPVPLAEVLGSVSRLVAGLARLSQVDVRIEIPADLPPVLADAGQLEHLFVNLCLNAIQAMPEAGGKLTIAARAAAPRKKRWVEISVRDTGRGIGPEHLERIFEPFFSLRANGVGLGLFSCRRIAEDHGGRLRVSSAPGAGTCFTLRLPAAL